VNRKNSCVRASDWAIEPTAAEGKTAVTRQPIVIEPTLDTEHARLIRQLGSLLPGRRRAALEKALRLDREQHYSLMRAVLRVYSGHRSRRELPLFLMMVAIGGTGLCIGLRMPLFLPLPLTVLAGSIADLIRQDLLGGSMARLFTQTKDTRLIPAMLYGKPHMDTVGFKERMRLFGNSLPRLLALSSPQEMETWPADTRQWLLAILKLPFVHPQLTVETLRTMVVIGNRDAEREIEKMAKMSLFFRFMRLPLDRWGPDPATTAGGRVRAIASQEGSVKRIQEAAQEVLPALRERLARLEQPQTLLRAAEMPSEPVADILLRPASGSPDMVPAEQLLRPTGDTAPHDTVRS
jgi:hypothetical protein